MAHVEQLAVYPVKGLNRQTRSSVTILDGGTLESDREFALVGADGTRLNGRTTDAVHSLDTTYDPDTQVLTIETADGTTHRLDPAAEPERAEAWFSRYFERDLTLERDTTCGFVDRRDMGPSVISTATLEEVASWFDELTVDGARRRLRANIEVGGVPAFWEDRFVGPDAPAFTAGGVRFEGVSPCGRCVVPQRDPETGEPTPEFRERFVERRRETFPAWADAEAFDHFYAVMVLTHVPERDRGATLEVGDPVAVLEDEATHAERA